LDAGLIDMLLIEAAAVPAREFAMLSASEANPLRISVWPVASHTFTPTGTGIT